MANFKTHLAVAAIGSGCLATVCLAAGLAQPKEVVLLALAGTAGGILPDIDLDHATPTKILFTALALVTAFMVLVSKADSYSLIELWIVWGVSYASVRYLAWYLFSELTVHRGIYHSQLAVVLFCFIGTALSYQLFDFPQRLSWLMGIFVGLGYELHLALDELYSVDFMNKRIKRSFGTATKLFDYKNITSSSLMAATVVLMFFMLPPIDDLWLLLSDGQTYQHLGGRIFPSGGWFSL
jgi:hypothetical protein